MIFNTNTTSLGSSIPMAEGYDGSIGCAKALVESARNDYAMFRAMLESDARELSLRSNGYVNESSIIALNEATVGGIWSKIKELIQKLIAKIKSIFANFLAKFKSLYASDKKLIKDYGTKVIRKRLDKMEIKWRKTTGSKGYESDTSIKSLDLDALVTATFKTIKGNTVDEIWDQDSDKRWNKVTTKLLASGGGMSNLIKNTDKFKNISDASDLKDCVDDALWDEESASKYDFEDIFSSGRELVTQFETFDKDIKETEKNVNRLTKRLDNELKGINKFANDAAKDAVEFKKSGKYSFKGKADYYSDTDDIDWSAADKSYIKSSKANGATDWTNSEEGTKGTDSETEKYTTKQSIMDTRQTRASHAYDICNVMNDIILIIANASLTAMKDNYKQTKAVFMKAVTVNDKKLEESSIYAQAVAEAAEDEVEDVITKELSNHDDWLSSTSNAPETVLDPGVDGYDLSYNPPGDTYSASYVTPPTAGVKDSTIVGTKNESAFFSRLLY